MNAMKELREGLLDAAERDVAAQRVRRRRSRRTIGVLVALALGGTAAATATDLIAIGDPSPELRTVDGFEKYEPTAARQVVLQADDPDSDLDYGVALYTATGAQTCALAGQLRGRQLGVVQGAVFRPYPADTIGACITPGRSTFDQRQVGRNVLVFGVAAEGVRQITSNGESQPPGPGGAFLFVFGGERPRGGFNVTFQ